MRLCPTFEEYITLLQERIHQLPGRASQFKMAPASRIVTPGEPNATTRKSAILMLLYPYQKKIYLPLILRAVYHGVHAGQVAFPGGRYERTDKDLIQTALREAQEEIGIQIRDVTVIGQLTELYVPVSNFLVQPVIGYLPYKPDFYPDPREVADILEVSLEELLATDNRKTGTFQSGNHVIEAPHYTIYEKQIWGATAMMISELQDLST